MFPIPESVVRDSLTSTYACLA